MANGRVHLLNLHFGRSGWRANGVSSICHTSSLTFGILLCCILPAFGGFDERRVHVTSPQICPNPRPHARIFHFPSESSQPWRASTLANNPSG